MNIEKANKKGFTLAEVLITLGIIGVVAALTIPTLMANYQKVQEVAGLKKAYAEITEALRLMANDHGCPDNLECTGVFTDDSNVLGAELKKYLKVAKDCGTTYDANDEKTKCLADSVSEYYDGGETSGVDARTNMNEDNYGNYNFITADGFSVSLSSNGGCFNWLGSGPNLNTSKLCGFAEIDVNGLKGPNNWGRDIFGFFITNGKGPALYPQGGSEEINTNDTTWVDSSGTPQVCFDGNPYGDQCAARIMEEGWQMKY